MAETTKFGVYDQENFSCKQTEEIPHCKNNGLQILFTGLSHDEKKLGFCLGKKKIKDETEISHIIIYKRNQKNKFVQEIIRDFEFHDACIQFTFNKGNTNELLFFTMVELFRFDYTDINKERQTVYTMTNVLVD